MPINKPSQPLIPPTDVEEVEEIATSAAEAAIAADDTHAPLVDNLVPAANLPSYVDDVLEFASTSVFPDPGEAGKIYVALDTNNTYRWSGSAYVQVGGSEIDLTPYALKTEVAAAVAPKADAADLAALSGEVALKADIADLTAVDAKVEVKADKPLDIVINTSDNSDLQTVLEGIDRELFYKICMAASNSSYTCHDNFGNKFTFKTTYLGLDELGGASAIALCEHNIEALDAEEYAVLDHPTVECYEAHIENDAETGDGRVVAEPMNNGSYAYVSNLPFMIDAESGDFYVYYPEATGLYKLVNSEDLSEFRTFGWFMCCGSNGWMASYLDYNVGSGDIPRFVSGPAMEVGDECYLNSNVCATIQELYTKQDRLVSGTNIKTINNQSILGSGNINIQGGDEENHYLYVEAVFENGDIIVNDFYCDDLPDDTWFETSPSSVIVNLSIYSETSELEWFSSSFVAYADGGDYYASACWGIHFDAGCIINPPEEVNFISRDGEIVETIGQPSHNLYAYAPDALMPIISSGMDEPAAIDLMNDIIVNGAQQHLNSDGKPGLIIQGSDSLRDTLTAAMHEPEFTWACINGEITIFRDNYGRTYLVEPTSENSCDLMIYNPIWGAWQDEDNYPYVSTEVSLETDGETGDVRVFIDDFQIYYEGYEKLAEELSATDLLVDHDARYALAANGIYVTDEYTSEHGIHYYFGGEYTLSNLSSEDYIIDLAINEQVTPDPDILPPLFIIKNSKSDAFEITTNNGASHEIIADDAEHEIDLENFQICYQTLSMLVPQEGLDEPDLTVVSSITVYYNYPNSPEFIESRNNDQVLQLDYNISYPVTKTAQDLYNDLYFVRNRELNNFIPKIPILVGTDTSAVADECYIQFNSSTEAFLCGSNGTIGFEWYHDKDLGELVVEIDWSLYNIGSGSTPTDSENHALMITATFENSAFTVTGFQCDDLKPNEWFANEPTTILLGLTITSGVNEWTVEAPVILYRVGASTYTSNTWQIMYAEKDANVSLLFTADGCNFIDNKGNIAFTLSSLSAPKYNLYIKTPDVLMPIPAENGSIDPSTLPELDLDGNEISGDIDILYDGEIYAGYGPMVPNVLLVCYKDAQPNQFGQLIDRTNNSGRTTITIRLLDDQFNPLDATMVITSEPQEEGPDLLTYVIYSKQLYCDEDTLNDWTITTSYVMDGWMAYEPHHPR